MGAFSSLKRFETKIYGKMRRFVSFLEKLLLPIYTYFFFN